MFLFVCLLKKNLRVQNLGSSLESPQSFVLSQNLFIEIHLPFVQVCSDIEHCVVGPIWLGLSPVVFGKFINKIDKNVIAKATLILMVDGVFNFVVFSAENLIKINLLIC